ncbi:MAG: hypothetical protein IPK99_13955 [Flavobacteriales bacterium]|nr:hypothetical protein [Flavobacteriales bacterium]
MSPRTAWPLPLATLLLLLPVLYNGFPLVYSDTGTYLTSGFQLGVPADRPIAYGLFCRIASLNGRTLWGPIVVQALLTAVLLWSGWRSTVGDRRWGHFAVAVGLLSICTGMGWYAGRLLPDAFTPLLVLASLGLLFHRAAWLWSLFLLALIAFACAIHFSHLVIAPGLVLFAWALSAISGGRISRPDPRGTLLVCAALVTAVIGLRESNRLAGHHAEVSRGGPLFLLGRMLDADVLRPGARSSLCRGTLGVVRATTPRPQPRTALGFRQSHHTCRWLGGVPPRSGSHHFHPAPRSKHMVWSC